MFQEHRFYNHHCRIAKRLPCEPFAKHQRDYAALGQQLNSSHWPESHESSENLSLNANFFGIRQCKIPVVHPTSFLSKPCTYAMHHPTWWLVKHPCESASNSAPFQKSVLVKPHAIQISAKKIWTTRHGSTVVWYEGLLKQEQVTRVFFYEEGKTQGFHVVRWNERKHMLEGHGASFHTPFRKKTWEAFGGLRLALLVMRVQTKRASTRFRLLSF